ncbi:MAG: hypothetical protein A2Z30_01100 [Chloroflexi bacterium RBG_16_64_43]|nr:MAG: hypothetical protein A2Z30_01100 [Chloroflexi bacterium RBG_16_64_43]
MTSRIPRGFIERLEDEGQPLRIAAPVSRELEIPETIDRGGKGPLEMYKATVFEKVNEFSMPGANYLLGSARRMAKALSVDHLGQLDLCIPQGMGALLERGTEMPGVLGEIAPRPQGVGRAACC